ncbi:MAG: hypothetical protein J5847_05915 [Clostridia bacterium]|nr:hypothetical protein [Clostridia bacterium]
MKHINSTPTEKTPYGGEHARVRPFADDQKIPAIATALLVVAIIAAILVFGQSRPMTATSVAPSDRQKTTVAADENAAAENEDLDADGSEDSENYQVENTIILRGDRAMEIFTASKKWLTRYGEDINAFAKTVPDRHVYVLLAPTSVEFYGPDEYKGGSNSFERAAEYAYTPMTAPNITTVNCRDLLAKHSTEYIYLRTDHHWTARGAYYAYVTFCKEAGLTPHDLSEYQRGEIEGFVGSLYGQTQEAILKQNPDTVVYYQPLTASEGYAFETPALTNGRSVKVVNTGVSSQYAYLCFIEGDNPILRFTTENKNGRSILMVKESYGNAMAPFLTDHYETVYVVDPRKTELNLTAFVQNQKIDDILFLNYAFAPSNPTYRTAFEKMLGV